MWKSVPSMAQYSRLLPNFRFPFFVCARALTEDLPSEIHCAPASHAITSLRGATSAMGPPLFDSETEAYSGPDGNRTIAGPLDVKHAPVARHYHLGRVVDLFVH
jgi:hypothetical protein